MKSIFDSIYDGDIRPSEDLLSWSDDLCALYAQSAEKLTAIRESLSDEQKAMLDEYAELKNRICDNNFYEIELLYRVWQKPASEWDSAWVLSS